MISWCMGCLALQELGLDNALKSWHYLYHLWLHFQHALPHELLQNSVNAIKLPQVCSSLLVQPLQLLQV